MTLPTFIIIGAQKCGTTSLYNYLTQHPQISPASTKELHFFDLNLERGIKWYKSQFPQCDRRQGIITGEATPYYIFHPHVPQRIFKYLPHVKLIVLLRNPVERAISHYYHNRLQIKKIKETLSFEEAIQQESARIKPELERMLADKNYQSFIHRSYSYLSRGIYIEQLKKWMKLFSREQFLILSSEDFAKNSAATVAEVFNFLELPEYQITNYKKANRRPHNNSIHESTRNTLNEYFKPYNQRLEEYLGMNFNWDDSNEKIEKSDSIYNEFIQDKKIIIAGSQAEKKDSLEAQPLGINKVRKKRQTPKTLERTKTGATIEDLKYLIVGTARSGTTFMTRAFNSIGINSGHERIFGPSPKAPKALTLELVKLRMGKQLNLQAESSWMAVPFLNTKYVPPDVSIIHLTRHPKKTIESLMAIGFFRRRHSAYTKHALLHTPEIKESDSELIKCCKWYLYWHLKIEKSGRELIHHRIEDDVRLLFDRLGLDYQGREIFNNKKSNTRNTKNRQEIDLTADIEDRNLLDKLVEMAEKYGYSITGDRQKTDLFLGDNPAQLDRIAIFLEKSKSQLNESREYLEKFQAKLDRISQNNRLH